MSTFNPASFFSNWRPISIVISVEIGGLLVVGSDPNRTSIRFQNTTPYTIFLGNKPFTTQQQAIYCVPANSEITFILEKDGGFVGQSWYYLAFNPGGYLYCLIDSFIES